MLISHELYRLSQGKLRKPISARHQASRGSTRLPRTPLVLDRPQTEREFLEEMTSFIDEQITSLSDQAHIFRVHQAAFDRFIAKFPREASQLQSVKNHYDQLIVDMQAEWEKYSALLHMKAHASTSSGQILERHEKTQKKRVALNEVIELLRALIPDIQQEIIDLKRTLEADRQAINEKMSMGRNLQVSVTDYKEFCEMLAQRRTRKREKAGMLEDELTRVRAAYEDAKKVMTGQLTVSWEMKGSLEGIKKTIAMLHTKELDPMHVQQMNAKSTCVRKAADVEALKRDAQAIEDETARIKEIIAIEVAKVRAKQAAKQRPKVSIENLIALSYYNRRMHVLSI
jgi:chromosome segregation ATPase